MNSQIEEIKNRIDIVDLISGYIKLQKAGRNYKAPCPFHSESSPSFMVSPERQLWRCFGCNKGGSVFDFIMEIEGVEFGDALKILAQRTGVELKKTDPVLAKQLNTERNRLYQICNLANQFFIKQLQAGKVGKEMKKYLISRGLKEKTIQEWQLGYAPNDWRCLKDFLNNKGYPDSEIVKTGLIVKSEKANLNNPYYDRFRDRIMFPLNDLNDQTVGFTGRENPNNPQQNMGKYINTPNTLIYDKSKLIYGLNKAKLGIRKNNLSILVEGQMDVINSHQAGFDYAIATSGITLSEQQIKIIKRYTNTLAMAFDMDTGGENATKRAIDLALAYGFNTKVIELPENQDPADVICKNKENWQKAIDSAEHIMEYHIKTALRKNNVSSAEGKKQIATDVLPIIKKVSNQVEQSHWLEELSKKGQIPENALRAELDKMKAAKIQTYQNSESKIFQTKKNIPLEEYTLGLLLTYPKEIKQCKNHSCDIFSDNNLQTIYQALKKNKSIQKTKKEISKTCQNQIDDLSFKVEAQQELNEDFEPKKEIEFCLFQLKKRHLKNKLQELNQQIKQAEQTNNKKNLEKLTKDFNNLLKQI